MGKFEKKSRRIVSRPAARPQRQDAERPRDLTEARRAQAQVRPQVSRKKKESRLTTGNKVFVYVVCVVAASIFLAAFAWVCMDDVCALTRREEVVTVTVPEDASNADLARLLKDKGLIRYKWLFKIYAGAARADEKVIPGDHELNKIFDYHALVNGMAYAGQRGTISLMIPEGYECKEIFALLEEKGVCKADALWEAAANGDFDYKFLEGSTLGDRNRLEGCLFPDTYEFYLNDTAENVLNKFLRNMDYKLTDELWLALDDLNAMLQNKMARGGFSQQEMEDGVLTMYQVLNVASLIEREAANSSEASVIASVIYNRLCSKQYPFLNIDATIQYALPERKEVLSNEDKLIDSPYNTYKYTGLPAGAIANPGMTSIRGALYPQDTNYYFYALNKDGTHKFTRNYAEHQAFLQGLNYG